MLRIVTCLWAPNKNSEPFSHCYDATWVDKLHRGFARNLTQPFESVCLTDCKRRFAEPVTQLRLQASEPNYGCLIEPFALEGPLIVCGLDMVILGNLDHFAEYARTGDKVALPRNPYVPEQSINPLALVPAGWRSIYEQWRGENDMEWLRTRPTRFLDDMWPGQVLSLKAHKVRDLGTQGARIIYMHGKPKPHDLTHLDWVRTHWR